MNTKKRPRRGQASFTCIVKKNNDVLEAALPSRIPKDILQIVRDYDDIPNKFPMTREQVFGTLVRGGSSTLDTAGARYLKLAIVQITGREVTALAFGAIGPNPNEGLLQLISERWFTLIRQENEYGARLFPFPLIAEQKWEESVTRIPCRVLAQFLFRFRQLRNFKDGFDNSMVKAQLESMKIDKETWIFHIGCSCHKLRCIK